MVARRDDTTLTTRRRSTMPSCCGRWELPTRYRTASGSMRVYGGRTKEKYLPTENTPSVADIFRRAQAIRGENAKVSPREIAAQLVREFSGGPLPPTYNLTIPEQDARAPQEDWSAGLPLVLRGIQQNDWQGIAEGITLSLEQTENYESQRVPEGTHDKWHDR